MARKHMDRVARAARRLTAAREERDAAIAAAVASGETTRDVGKLAGLTHQRVSEIARSAKKQQ